MRAFFRLRQGHAFFEEARRRAAEVLAEGFDEGTHGDVAHRQRHRRHGLLQAQQLDGLEQPRLLAPLREAQARFHGETASERPARHADAIGPFVDAVRQRRIIGHRSSHRGKALVLRHRQVQRRPGARRKLIDQHAHQACTARLQQGLGGIHRCQPVDQPLHQRRDGKHMRPVRQGRRHHRVDVQAPARGGTKALRRMGAARCDPADPPRRLHPAARRRLDDLQPSRSANSWPVSCAW